MHHLEPPRRCIQGTQPWAVPSGRRPPSCWHHPILEYSVVGREASHMEVPTWTVPGPSGPPLPWTSSPSTGTATPRSAAVMMAPRSPASRGNGWWLLHAWRGWDSRWVNCISPKCLFPSKWPQTVTWGAPCPPLPDVKISRPQFRHLEASLVLVRGCFLSPLSSQTSTHSSTGKSGLLCPAEHLWAMSSLTDGTLRPSRLSQAPSW